MSASPQQIHGLLRQQRDTAHKLLQTLNQEHTGLSGNDLQGIETILAAKEQCMGRLEQLSQDFLAITPRHSPEQKDAIAAFLRSRDPQGAWGLEPLWRQIEKLLSQCRQKNNLNGKVISLSRRHVQQALTILLHGGQGSEPCYSPTGVSQPAASSRILGKV